jgi:hypothetical protein
MTPSVFLVTSFLKMEAASFSETLLNTVQNCTVSHSRSVQFNPLNAELNPICHLLVLLGAHRILHVSGVRVNYHIHESLRCLWNVCMDITVGHGSAAILRPRGG